MDNYQELRQHIKDRGSFRDIEHDFKIFKEKQFKIISENHRLVFLKLSLLEYIKINTKWYLNYVAVNHNEQLF
jgi:transposase-like protein